MGKKKRLSGKTLYLSTMKTYQTSHANNATSAADTVLPESSESRAAWCRTENAPTNLKFSVESDPVGPKHEHEHMNTNMKYNIERGNKSMYPTPEPEYSKIYKDFLAWRKNKCGKSTFKINEIKGDLFAASSKYSLCHCVAEDLAMGSGIAIAFKKKFKKIEELMEQRQKTGGVAVLQDNERFIYYLVTKQLSRGKPTNDTLLQSLVNMKEHMILKGVSKLAMPTIGCGLDRLRWEDVSSMIQFVFEDTDVQIDVYHLEQKDDGDDYSTRTDRRAKIVVDRPIPLVDMEHSTVLIFIASTDHTITPQINDLNNKFNFLPEYQQDKDTKLGYNFYVTKKNELIAGLYIKENQGDPFSFINLVSCLKKLNNHIKKLGTYYIGIDSFTDENDEIIMEKLNNLFKTYLTNYQIHVCKRQLE